MANIDLLIAQSKHLEWKFKLRSFLEGCEKWTLTEGQATSHKECELGRWLYSHGLEKYGGFSATRELERTHEELHSTIKRVVQMKRAGNQAEVEEESSKVEPFSHKIVALLEQLEKQVREHAEATANPHGEKHIENAEAKQTGPKK
jgi:methyl-accepting chemotaxis protein